MEPERDEPFIPRVFLVEDEYVMREGIKNSVDWSANGYEFCGEAGDGEQAYPLILKARPDIVITDIKMPFMDGLALSRLIKKELPQTEIIILSGYEEFEYAKTSIQIGVAEYLLKPISSEELLQAIGRLAEKIGKKRTEAAILERYSREMEEKTLQERKDFFRDLVRGTHSVPELLEAADRLEIDVTAPFYNVVLFKTISNRHAAGEYSDTVVRAEDEIKAMIDESEVLLFDRYLEGKGLLFKADSEEELRRIQERYLKRIVETLQVHRSLHYFGGIGQPVSRLSEVPASFEAASHAFAHQYLTGENRIIDSSDLESLSGNELHAEEDLDVSGISPKQFSRRKIQDFLKVGDRDETVYFVEEFYREMGEKLLGSNVFRQYITMDAYFCVIDFLDDLGLDRDKTRTVETVSGTILSMEKSKEYLIRIIRQAIELRESVASNRHHSVVEEAIRYIEENYADEELNLNTLASSVNLSPNHLSMIFSEETGSTFIKYLTDYRIGKAKELLRCTNQKSSAIGLEVGYRDPHYFSFLFKKTLGMTPTQYRSSQS